MLFKNKHLFLIFLLILPILIASLPDSQETRIRAGAARLFSPALKILTNLEKKTVAFLSPSGASARVRFLQEEIQSLKRQNSQLKDLALENARLKGLLSFKKAARFKILPALVIAKDTSNYRKSIIIDKGSSSGVRKNMYIMGPSGLAGRIYDTGRNSSRAILLTDPEFRVAAGIQNSRESGIICGNATPLCALKYLSEDAGVEIGDTVVSSGFGKFCPKGVLIGEVVGLERTVSSSGFKARVRPSVRLGRIEEVLVILED